MASAALDGLPPLLVEIAAVTDLDAALTLARERGGERVTIPAYPGTEGCWLTLAIGPARAAALCAHFRTVGPDGVAVGYRCDIPRGPYTVMGQAKSRYRAARAEGASVRKAARAAGIHQRTAWRYEAERDEADNRGPDLFDAIER